MPRLVLLAPLLSGCAPGAIELFGMNETFGPVRSAVHITTTVGEAEPVETLVLTERPFYCGVYTRLYPELVAAKRAFEEADSAAEDAAEGCAAWKDYLDVKAEVLQGLYVDGHRSLTIDLGLTIGRAAPDGGRLVRDGEAVFAATLDLYAGNPYEGASALVGCDVEEPVLVEEVDGRRERWFLDEGELTFDREASTLILEGELIEKRNQTAAFIEAEATLALCEIEVE